MVAANAPGPTLVVDATPLQNAHSHRGIGSYVRGLLSALGLARSRVWGVLAYPGRLDAIEGRVRVAPVIPRHPRQLEFHGGWLLDELLLGRRLGKTAVFHATDPRRIPSRRAPVVATVYDLTPMHDAAVWDSLWPDQRIAYRLSLRRIRSSDAVVAISQAVKADVETMLGIPPPRVHVVYPAIRVVSPDPGRARDSRSLLFVGSSDPHKNFEVLLEALSILPADERPSLTVAGPWSDDAIRSAVHRARQLGIQPPTLRPHASDGVLDSLYRSASALVIPSRREGFGLPLIEAMAHGLPVIAADIPVLREVAGGAAWHVPVGDPAALAGAISSLLRDPEAQRRMSDRGIKRGESFSRAATLESLAGAYRSVGVMLQ